MWLWNPKNHLCENMAPSLLLSLCNDLSSCQSLLQTCAVVSAAPQFDYSNIQPHSILKATPSLQVIWVAHENALAESESTLQSSRGSWEHLGVLRSSGEDYQGVWEVCVWFPDWNRFCWWGYVDASHSLSAFDYLCVGLGPGTPPSTCSATGKRYLLTGKSESMNSKRSTADSQWWRS